MQRIRALSVHCSFRTWQNKRLFCHSCREKNSVLHRIKIPERKGSTPAKAVIAALSQLPKSAVKNNYLRPRIEVCKLARNRKCFELPNVLCRSVLRLAKRNERETKWPLREFYPKGHNLSRVSSKTLWHSLTSDRNRY